MKRRGEEATGERGNKRGGKDDRRQNELRENQRGREGRKQEIET